MKTIAERIKTTKAFTKIAPNIEECYCNKLKLEKAMIDPKIYANRFYEISSNGDPLPGVTHLISTFLLPVITQEMNADIPMYVCHYKMEKKHGEIIWKTTSSDSPYVGLKVFYSKDGANFDLESFSTPKKSHPAIYLFWGKNNYSPCLFAFDHKEFLSIFSEKKGTNISEILELTNHPPDYSEIEYKKLNLLIKNSEIPKNLS